jgi:tape measure domain-containing protein
MSGGFKTMSTNVASSMSLIGKALVFGSFGVFIKSALETSAQLEQTAISFEVFTGSAEVANNMLGQLKQQALSSPMQFQDIAKGAQTLLGYGLTAEQVIPITKMLGDVSGGNADKFARLSLAFGQVNAAGRLMGQEARQMINAGFNPLQAISDKTGVSMAVLTQRMKDGQISVKDVGDAFTYATSEGGRFFGMADRQSQTLQGQFNKLSESVTFSMAEIGTSISENLQLGDVIGHVSILVDKLKTSFINLNQGTNNSSEFNRLLKGTLDVLAISIDLCIKAWGVLTATLGGLLKLATPVVDFFDFLDAAIIKSSKILPSYISDIGKLIKYVNNFAKVDSIPNDAWIGPGSVTESVVFLENKLKELESRQAFNVKFNKTGIQDTIDKITEARIALDALQKITGKPQGIPGLDNNPPGMGGGKSKEQALAKAKRLHDQWISSEVQYYDKIRALEKEDRIAGLKVRNWWSTNETDKLMDMKAAFASRIEEFKLFGVSYINKEKEFNSKVAELRRDQVEATEKARNRARQGALVNPAQQLFNDKMIKDAMSFNNIVDKIASQDKLAKINDYSQAMYSSLRDFSQNIYAGFGEMAASAILGGFTFEQAFNQLGNFFLNSIGDLLIQMGNSAIKLGISSEAIQAALASIGVPGGGFAAIAAGTLAVAAGSMLKGLASKNKDGISAKQGTTTVTANAGKLSGMASGSSYNYGGSSYAAQTVKLSIDLTGAITATQTGYSINKSLETTLRVTGR